MDSKDDRAIVGTTMTDATVIALIGHSAAGKSQCLKLLKLDRQAADMDVAWRIKKSPTFDQCMDWLTDKSRPPVVVVSNHEDIVNARLFFENGAIADLTASRVNPEAKRGMQVWSALWCVNVDLQSREVTSYSPSEALRYGRSPLELAGDSGADIEQLKADIFGRFIEVNSPPVAAGDALTAELQEFVDCVRNQTKPGCSGHEALEALKVAELILQSIASHNWGQSGNMAAAA